LTHMVIGTCVCRLRLAGCRSLKDKRRVVRPLVQRLRQKFLVSATEVDLLDSRNQAVIGMALVSTDSHHVVAVLERAVTFIDRELPGYLVDYHVEVL